MARFSIGLGYDREEGDLGLSQILRCHCTFIYKNQLFNPHNADEEAKSWV
jgi:hypothetical protein